MNQTRCRCRRSSDSMTGSSSSSLYVLHRPGQRTDSNLYASPITGRPTCPVLLRICLLSGRSFPRARAAKLKRSSSPHGDAKSDRVYLKSPFRSRRNTVSSRTDCRELRRCCMRRLLGNRSRFSCGFRRHWFLFCASKILLQKKRKKCTYRNKS